MILFFLGEKKANSKNKNSPIQQDKINFIANNPFHKSDEENNI